MQTLMDSESKGQALCPQALEERHPLSALFVKVETLLTTI